MDAITHTIVVLVTVLGSYWMGLTRGYIRGLDEGTSEGSAIALKRALEWMRKKHDIHITDYEINEASEYLRNERS